MKTRTATALSLVGVLAAGTAAALANTHVLSSRAASNEAPDILTINTVPGAGVTTLAVEPLVTPGAPVDPSGAPVGSPLPALASDQSSTQQNRPVATSPITNPQSAAAPVAPAWAAVRYAVGEAGLVELRYQSDVIEVSSVLPRAGWTAIVSDAPASSSVAVILSSTMAEITFTASLLDGRIVTDVSSRSLVSSTNGSAGSLGGSGGGGEHDDDGEDHDGQHHDDDHHDDGHEEHDDDDD